MTKLAHIHFTTNQQASNRILAMGEEDWRVHTVGFPAIDLISDGNFATAAELQALYSLNLSKPVILFTQHSVTTEFDQAKTQTSSVFDALRQLAAEGSQIIATYPNNDAGGRAIIEELNNLEKENVPGIQIHQSLGRYNYHGVLALARSPEIQIVCAGNSSSGIKETPAFGCPTVNIGSRQDGRLRAENVIDSDYSKNAVVAAVQNCFSDTFRSISQNCENPYGIGDAGVKIANELAKVSLGTQLIRKRMTLKGAMQDGWYQ
jgi:UDP-N-acetylglucosamine 2-epimerase (non-hydrolysing)/GDP/UDP-N,N'-diacetylbacillosamine 2-epimerase (hydrolysing)